MSVENDSTAFIVFAYHLMYLCQANNARNKMDRGGGGALFAYSLK